MPDAPATVVPAAPGPSAADVAAKAAQTTIRAADLPRSLTPEPAPKPGSARARLSESLRKQFGGEEPAPRPGADDSNGGGQPPEAGTADKPAPGTKDTEGQAGNGTEGAQAQPGENKPAGRVSPWKLVDQFKQRALAAETKLLELERSLPPEPQRQAIAQRAQQLEQAVQQMSQDLRYYRAEKYDPDIIKADAEYQGAWKRAISELREIPVTDPTTQQTRAITAEDLLELVNLPLGQARDIADNVFGKFADDVMNHRKEIRALFEAKSAKLEELKKTGAARDQQRAAAFQQFQNQLHQSVAQIYEQANQAALADPTYGAFFKPREGDTEWNSRLENGFKFVDEAYAINVSDPRLTPEQRAEVVRRHAAVRNRAASWGALRHENGLLQKQIAALEKELKGYKATTPAAGGRAGTAQTGKVSAWDSIRGDLAKLARH